MTHFGFGRFIGGRDISAAMRRINQGCFLPIYDYAKEGTLSQEDAVKYAKRMICDSEFVYEHLNPSIEPLPYIALKYSSFGGDNELLKSTTLTINRLLPVVLDAEDDGVHASENVAFKSLLGPNIFKTYQMYRRDSMSKMIEDMREYPDLGIKLVRGAYLQSDRNLPGVLYTTKKETDANYNAAITYLAKQVESRKIMIASHNNASLELAATLFDCPWKKRRILFAQLLGMNDAASHKLRARGFTVYKYVPYGSYFETLPYLVRRLYENLPILKHSF